MDSSPNKTNGPVSRPPADTNGFLHPKSAPASLTPRLLPIQIIILAIYPITVLLGLVSNHPPDSYFARKDNFINVYLLKFAWFWTTIAFFAHVVRVPRKAAPVVRYLVATMVWYLVTQWCFGPPIMDKVFRGTGGICQIAKNEEFPNVFTSAVCRSSGGVWGGGHDLSGHIFILTHASLFLWWELLPHFSMPEFMSTAGTKVNLVMLVIYWYSLLNTATYFHTVTEKVSGLIAGLIGWYLVEVASTFVLETAGL